MDDVVSGGPDRIDGWRIELKEDEDSNEEKVAVGPINASAENLNVVSDHLEFPNLTRIFANNFQLPILDEEQNLSGESVAPISNNVSMKSIENMNPVNGTTATLTENDLRCSVCGKEFTKSREWMEHMSIHFGQKTYDCPWCSKSHGTLGRLDLHVRQHDGPAVFFCSVCHTQFVDFYSYQKHVATHVDGVPRRRSNLIIKDRIFKCMGCSHSFGKKRLLEEHLFSNECGIKAEQYSRRHVKVNFLKSERQSTEEAENSHNGLVVPHVLFRCSVCFGDFADCVLLSKHLKIHSREALYECMQCGKGFLSRYYVKTHATQHCGREGDERSNSSYECQEKPKAAKSDEPFKCSQCPKSFSTQQKLNDHIKLHTGYYRYKCSICDKTYRYCGSYENHMVSVHEEMKCKQCKTLFVNKGVYLKHVEQCKKRRLECKICQLKFYTLSKLEKHRINHHSGRRNLQSGTPQMAEEKALRVDRLAQNTNSSAGAKAKKRNKAIGTGKPDENCPSKKRGLLTAKSNISTGPQTVKQGVRTKFGPFAEIDVNVPTYIKRQGKNALRDVDIKMETEIFESSEEDDIPVAALIGRSKSWSNESSAKEEDDIPIAALIGRNKSWSNESSAKEEDDIPIAALIGRSKSWSNERSDKEEDDIPIAALMGRRKSWSNESSAKEEDDIPIAALISRSKSWSNDEKTKWMTQHTGRMTRNATESTSKLAIPSAEDDSEDDIPLALLGLR